MIKRSKHSNGLREYQNQVQYIDTDNRSKHYFRLFDVPEKLYVGKNVIGIAPNMDLFVPNSKIYIDVYDAVGNIMYHEIVKTVNLDKTRTILIYVYPESQPGAAKIYIAGRLRYDPYTGQEIEYSLNSNLASYRDVPNVMWIGETYVVTTEPNTSEILFLDMPTVTYDSIMYRTFLIPNANRATSSYSNNNTISLTSLPSPYQYMDGGSKFADDVVQSQNVHTAVPIASYGLTGTGTTSDYVNLSEYGQQSVVSTTSSFFNADMVGGRLTVNNINLGYGITNASYTASIVKVINDTTAIVDRPFSRTATYIVSGSGTVTSKFTKFVRQSEFTCSYYNATLVPTVASSSFDGALRLTFTGMEPIVGVVDYIRVMYKEMARLGEFVDVGKIPVVAKEYMKVDDYVFSLENGLVPASMGYFSKSGSVSLPVYWSVHSESFDSIRVVSKTTSNANIQDGIAIRWTGRGPLVETDYVAFHAYTVSPPTLYAGSEYKLSFSACYAGPTSGSWAVPTMDIYLTGSLFITEDIKKPSKVQPLPYKKFGTYIGSLETDGKIGSTFDAEYFFIPKRTATVSPVFVMRNGYWDIGKIGIKPRKEIGYSPSEFYAIIPISDKIRSSELMMRVEYYNSAGVKSKHDTVMYGLFFTGSIPLPVS